MPRPRPAGEACRSSRRKGHRSLVRRRRSERLGRTLLGMERGAGAAAAERGEPADRVPIGRTAVEAEGDELGAAAEILPGNRAAEALLGEREAAVGAMVAIVAHQEDVAFGDGDLREIVALADIVTFDRM